MKICKNCGKEIIHNKVFCNQQCRDEYNEKRKYVKTNCDYCGKEFLMRRNSYNRWISGKQKHKFCSSKCSGSLTSKISSEKRKTGVYRVCPNCKKVYYVKPSHMHRMKFCSRKCYDESRIITTNCDLCGKEYQVNHHRYYKHKRHFCSKDCKDYYMNNIWCKSKEGKNHYKKLSKIGFKAQINMVDFKLTKPEQILKNILDSNNIINIPQKFMHDKFFVDFYLPKNDIVIEVFGDYWHGNPKFYNDNKLLTNKQLKQKSKDKSRISYLSKAHKKVLIFWEDELVNDEQVDLKVLKKITN